MASDTLPTQKRIVYASWKVFEISDWEPRNGDSGLLGKRSAIFLEKNSSITSQLSLNLGIFRTSVSLSYLQEEEAEKVENVAYSVVFDTPMNDGENVS